jgi:fluoride exporter
MIYWSWFRWLSVCAFAMLGVALRLLTDWLLADVLDVLGYHSALFASLGSNCMGSLLLAIVVELKRAHRFDGSETLYTGLSTGLCGSYSTFSSWLYAASWAATNTVSQNSAAEKAAESIAILLVGIALPLTSYTFGRHLFYGLGLRKGDDQNRNRNDDDGNDDRRDDNDDDDEPLWMRVVLVVATVSVLVALCFVAGFVCDARIAVMSVLLGPIGATLRWQGAHFNRLRWLPWRGALPWATLLLNVSGSLILTFAVVGLGALDGGDVEWSAVSSKHCSWVAVVLLDGLASGLAGSMTTVSSFVGELHALPTFAAYRYGAMSVLISYALLLLINGLYFWHFNGDSVVASA